MYHRRANGYIQTKTLRQYLKQILSIVGFEREIISLSLS